MEQDVRISHEWINQYMHADKRSGADLYCYLRCRKKRPKRYGSYDRRGIIPKQVSIDERPAVVDTRQRYGDWEGDTVTNKEIKHAMDKLNYRPKKTLGYRTPYEVFFNTKTSLTVHSVVESKFYIIQTFFLETITETNTYITTI